MAKQALIPRNKLPHNVPALFKRSRSSLRELARLYFLTEVAGKAPRYTGIDLSPDMIRGARERRPDLDLREGDPFSVDGQWDVVVANGVFYLLQEAPTETMHAIITRMFELCSHCCVFSSLSSWGPSPEEGEFCADPLETVEFCRTLTPWVKLDHAYLPHDFAVVLHREPCRDAAVD